MQAAELCLSALKIATDSSQRSDIRLQCQSLLEEAERIKLDDKWQPLIMMEESTSDVLLPSDPTLTTSSENSSAFLPEGSSDRASSNSVSNLSLNQLAIRDPSSGNSEEFVRFFGAQAPPRGSASVTLKEPSSKRELAKSEQIILLRGSKLNGYQFPPWKDAPDPEWFTLDEENGSFW
jgi:calpain-7